MSSLDEALPADLEGRDSIVGKFGSVEDLASSYHSLSKKMGESTRVPGESSSPEEWSSFYRGLGAPESHEGYPIPEGSTEELEGTLKTARKNAFLKGVSVDQWEEVINPILQLEKDRKSSLDHDQAESVKKWQEAAKEKYGSQFESKSALAERAYNNVVKNNPELDRVFSLTGMGHHPEVMDFMIRMGASMSDERTPSSLGGSDFGTDHNSLAARARKLAKTGAIYNSRHPDYEEHYSEFMNIQKQLAEDGYEGMHDKRLQPDQSWIRGK